MNDASRLRSALRLVEVRVSLFLRQVILKIHFFHLSPLDVLKKL